MITRPEGETDLLCRIPAEVAEKLQEWTEVAYIRLVRHSDAEVELQLAREEDLERITAPEADSAP